AGQTENSRRKRARTHCRKQERIDRVCADRQLAAAIAGRDWKLPNRCIAARWNERPVRRIDGRRGPRRSSAPKHAMISDVELPEQPVEPELLQIILIDLDKLRFDLDLLRSGNARL